MAKPVGGTQAAAKPVVRPAAAARPAGKVSLQVEAAAVVSPQGAEAETSQQEQRTGQMITASFATPTAVAHAPAVQDADLPMYAGGARASIQEVSRRHAAPVQQEQVQV